MTFAHGPNGETFEVHDYGEMVTFGGAARSTEPENPSKTELAHDAELAKQLGEILTDHEVQLAQNSNH